MRVAIGIHREDVNAAIETYDAMSRGECTHATPTLLHAGTCRPQMASCFLMTVPEDSIEGLYEAVGRCAVISKHAGGIGVDVGRVRARGSRIRSSDDGIASGLIAYLQVLDRVARHVTQSGGKRRGAIAAYLEPWHADVFEVLEARKNHGTEDSKARDVFLGLWINDLFMQRVENGETWSLFCPADCEELCDSHGSDFVEHYIAAERDGKARQCVEARDLWASILDAQIETGTPYMLYKDACNRKSNHRHLGTLRCSNLCTEIIEYVAPDEVAVCNLASISLPACLVCDGPNKYRFDYALLEKTTRLLVRNLNIIIDTNFYPIEDARKSNMRHRPTGIGVQGLADVFHVMLLPFASPEARKLNKNIFETIYFSALCESCALARASGQTYDSYDGSPAQHGELQPDMWGVSVTDDRHDWTRLRAQISQHGIRNSLLVAPMPTASTAQILGNTEAFEPITSNLYTRRVLAGEFFILNRHMVKALQSLGLWTPATRESLLRNSGSLQAATHIPQHLRDVFRTAWEMRMKDLVDMAADRAPFIDQSASLNVFMSDPSHEKLTALHLHAWKRGLKTGTYYIRTRAAAEAANVSVSPRAPPAVCERSDACTACAA